MRKLSERILDRCVLSPSSSVVPTPTLRIQSICLSTWYQAAFPKGVQIELRTEATGFVRFATSPEASIQPITTFFVSEQPTC